MCNFSERYSFVILAASFTKFGHIKSLTLPASVLLKKDSSQSNSSDFCAQKVVYFAVPTTQIMFYHKLIPHVLGVLFRKPHYCDQ